MSLLTFGSSSLRLVSYQSVLSMRSLGLGLALEQLSVDCLPGRSQSLDVIAALRTLCINN